MGLRGNCRGRLRRLRCDVCYLRWYSGQVGLRCVPVMRLGGMSCRNKAVLRESLSMLERSAASSGTYFGGSVDLLALRSREREGDSKVLRIKIYLSSNARMNHYN